MLETTEKLVDKHTRDQILGAASPYIDTKLPTNQGSPLELRCPT